MAIFEGLFPFEIVLLVLGVVLFLVLLALLVFSVISKQNIKVYALLLPIPIVMIGWPGIQKIKIDRDGIEIDRLVSELRNEPNNKIALQQLTQKLQQTELLARERQGVLGPKLQATVREAQVAITRRPAPEPEAEKEPPAPHLKIIPPQIR
jgi:hypothetical protein